MKKLIISTLISIIALLFLSTVFSITLSLLHYYKGTVLNNVIIQVISIVIFIISGFVFGLINKKQGLLGSIVFILVYLIFILVFDVFVNTHNVDNLYFLYVIGKCIAYCIGAVLSVNIKTK